MTTKVCGGSARRRLKRDLLLALAAATLYLGGCGEAAAPPPELAATAESATTELTVVVVGEYPASAVAELGGFLSWLNKGLAPEGLRMGAEVAGSVPEAAEWLASGAVDFYLDSPHPILLARHLSGCRPMLRRWKYGTATYDSVIFTREDSGVKELAGLLGKTIAFEDRYSSSSFFMPVEWLMSKGLDGVFMPSAADPVPSDRLGFVFSGGDSNTMHWVLAGKVVAGAMNPWNLDNMAADSRAQLRVLTTTEETPRHLVAVRSDLDAAIERKVRDLLLSAHLSPEGREMLAGFSSTDRFDEIPADFMGEIDRLQEAVVRLDAMVSSSLAGGGAP